MISSDQESPIDPPPQPVHPLIEALRRALADERPTNPDLVSAGSLLADILACNAFKTTGLAPRRYME